MYKGYKIEISDFPTYVSLSSQLDFKQKRKDTFIDLQNYLLTDQTLSASLISDELFPSLNADIFLSHSHADEDLAIKIATGLEDQLGLKVFIDSCVWAYANDLLRELDKKYCMSSNGIHYDYDKRNNSTAHVHMLLISALHKMIDKSEVFLFLDSSNSAPIKDFIEGDKTYSPWIYSELQFSSQVKRKLPQRALIKSVASSEGRALDMVTENLKIAYDLTYKHLINFPTDSFDNWVHAAIDSKAKGKAALDLLYGS